MSDIPEKFMTAAREAYESLSVACVSSSPIDFRAEDITIIARALMAAANEADEAATKQERERCGSLAFSFVGEAPEDDAPINVYDEAVNTIATAISAAILKGEA